jgi:23S rRNA (cytidine2498-2'-O)-methyltransferase
MASPEPVDGTIYLAAEGFEAELEAELGRAARRLVPGAALFLAPGPARPVAWARNTWLSPVRLRFESVAAAAATLRSLADSWALYPTALPRRAALVAQGLPRMANPQVAFPPKSPLAPVASWTLVGEGEIIAAARCTSPFVHGEPRFVEDRERPPSRAYLKLWEAFVLAGRWPRPGARCVDLGSSPGGWTWALERLGARVISVDKAPIAPSLTRLTRVRYLQESAFAVDPAKVGRVDWLVSDVICYPDRSVPLVVRWLEAHPSASFVVTIKLQGPTDMKPLARLATIPGARLVHLFHNKHELTWMRILGEP